MRVELILFLTDLRSTWKTAVLCALPVVFGTALLVAIWFFRGVIQESIRADTKALLGADVVFYGSEAIAPAVKEVASQETARAATDLVLTTNVSVTDISHSTWNANVHVVSGSFPLYGKLTTIPGGASSLLHRQRGAALIDRLTAEQQHLQVGDQLEVGRCKLTMVGIFDHFPGEMLNELVLLPRIMVSAQMIELTDLNSSAKPIRMRYGLAVADDSDLTAVIQTAEFLAQGTGMKHETAASRAHLIDGVITRINGALLLISFVVLTFAALGIWVGIDAFLGGKNAAIDLLRSLGATRWQACGAYFAEAALLIVASVAIGSMLGLAVAYYGVAAMVQILPFELVLPRHWGETLWPLFVGGVITLLLTLLSVVHSIRYGAPDTGQKRKVNRWMRGTVYAAFLCGFAMTMRLDDVHLPTSVGMLYLAACGLGTIGLWGVARLFQRVALKLAVSWSNSWFNIALLRFGRPGRATAALIASLGMSAFLLTFLLSIYVATTRELQFYYGPHSPDLLVGGIPQSQLAQVRRELEQKGAEIVATSSETLVEVTGINGKKLPHPQPLNTAGLDSVPPGDTIVSGRFFGESGSPLILSASVDKNTLRQLNAALGDFLQVELGSIPVTLKITSVRSGMQIGMGGTYPIVVSRADLAGAPVVNALFLRKSPALSAEDIRRTITEYQGAYLINFELAKGRFVETCQKAVFLFRILAAFSIAIGAVVYLCILVSREAERVNDTAILRIIGATPREASAVVSTENTLASAAAAVVGVGLTLFVLRFVAGPMLQLRSLYSPGALLMGALAILMGTSFGAYVAARLSIRISPLELFRTSSR